MPQTSYGLACFGATRCQVPVGCLLPSARCGKVRGLLRSIAGSEAPSSPFVLPRPRPRATSSVLFLSRLFLPSRNRLGEAEVTLASLQECPSYPRGSDHQHQSWNHLCCKAPPAGHTGKYKLAYGVGGESRQNRYHGIPSRHLVCRHQRCDRNCGRVSIGKPRYGSCHQHSPFPKPCIERC